MSTLRVLVVARWYPSHDAPGRGSFVADQVAALGRIDCEVVVASWEPALLTGSDADVDAAAERWAAAIASSDELLATPRSWGAGVPVARLPAVMPSDVGLRHPVDLARWQAATLVRFGTLLAETWPFDVIHAHTGLPDGLAAVALADRLDLPLLTTEHDGSLDRRLADDRARSAYRSLVGPRRGLVAVSSLLADQAAALSGLERSSIGVIPNLVDSALFHPDPSIPRDRSELLWVGNRKVSKGMNELLDAFAAVSATRPDLHLRLIGDAPTPDDDRRLRDRATDLGIAARVRFEPSASRTEVAAAMARAGLFVHPSPTESFGIVALEALGCGLPVVACAPTIAAVLGRDGSRGEVAAGSDRAALQAAIERAVDRMGSFDEERLVAAAAPYRPDAVASAILAGYRALGVEPDRARSDRPPSAAAGGQPAATSVRLVVAGRRRSALDRIGHLSPTTSGTLTVVTSNAGESPPPPPAASWIEVDPDRRWRIALDRVGGTAGRTPHRSLPRRVLDAIRHPWRTIARRRLMARRSELALQSRADAVRATYAALPPGTPVIALDSDDLATIHRAGLDARLGPGMLRWIADRDDAAPGG